MECEGEEDELFELEEDSVLFICFTVVFSTDFFLAICGLLLGGGGAGRAAFLPELRGVPRRNGVGEDCSDDVSPKLLELPTPFSMASASRFIEDKTVLSSLSKS